MTNRSSTPPRLSEAHGLLHQYAVNELADALAWRFQRLQNVFFGGGSGQRAHENTAEWNVTQTVDELSKGVFFNISVG